MSRAVTTPNLELPLIGAIESRHVRYPKREKAPACYKLPPFGNTKFVRTDDPGGSGRECEREAMVCHDCFVKLAKPT